MHSGKLIRREEMSDIVKTIIAISLASLVPIMVRKLFHTEMSVILNMVVASCALAVYVLAGFVLRNRTQRWLLLTFLHRKDNAEKC